MCREPGKVACDRRWHVGTPSPPAPSSAGHEDPTPAGANSRQGRHQPPPAPQRPLGQSPRASPGALQERGTGKAPPGCGQDWGLRPLGTRPLSTAQAVEHRDATPAPTQVRAGPSPAPTAVSTGEPPGWNLGFSGAPLSCVWAPQPREGLLQGRSPTVMGALSPPRGHQLFPAAVDSAAPCRPLCGSCGRTSGLHGRAGREHGAALPSPSAES